MEGEKQAKGSLASAEIESTSETVNRKLIFISSVDLYAGKSYAKFLSQCTVGATVEEADVEEDDERDSDNEGTVKPGTYEIVGTLSDETQLKPEFVSEIIKFNTREELYQQLVKCDVIVYDITEDFKLIEEAVWAATEIHANLEKIDKKNPKTFILVSTVLTWARSKVNEEDPELPFMEEDYRKRRPHPDFKDHIEAEREITKLGKTNKVKFSTYVIAAGLMYGAEESVFHYLFKAGWHNSDELVCYGKGSNIVPTVHVRDVAAVIQNIADSRPKVRYMVAVDESSNTLYSITKAISQALTTGKVKKISVSDALLIKDLKQRDLSCLTVDLRMSSAFIKESMTISWHSEEGIVENIEKIVEEYKACRNLLPMRLMVVGPPSCGKTTVVRQLCQHFKLHHVNIKDVINEAIGKRTKYLQDLKERDAQREEELARLEMGEEEEQELEDEEEEEEEEEGKEVECEKLLEAVKESREQNAGRIEDALIISFLREKLLSKPCQNQGFIIDGFPRGSGSSVELARKVFAIDEEEIDEADEATEAFDKRLMPELIFNLEASDEFIRRRIINLPESAVVGTHNTEQGLSRRLTEYRNANTDDETLLNYFDEFENHAHKIDITSDESLRMKETVEKIIRLVPGGPRNYGPTEEEKQESERIEMEERIKKEEEESKEREGQEAEEKLLKEKQRKEWSEKFSAVTQEERDQLTAKAEPLRNYLMRFVMPTLTQGLVECCKVRPEDPVDYLAEYLFKNNPQVD